VLIDWQFLDIAASEGCRLLLMEEALLVWPGWKEVANPDRIPSEEVERGRPVSQTDRQSDSANCRQAKMIADKYWQGNPRLLYTSHTHGDARGKVRRTKGKMRNFNANRKQKRKTKRKCL